MVVPKQAETKKSPWHPCLFKLLVVNGTTNTKLFMAPFSMIISFEIQETSLLKLFSSNIIMHINEEFGWLETSQHPIN